jgi:hypothetical protein
MIDPSNKSTKNRQKTKNKKQKAENYEPEHGYVSPKASATARKTQQGS